MKFARVFARLEIEVIMKLQTGTDLLALETVLASGIYPLAAPLQCVLLL